MKNILIKIKIDFIENHMKKTKNQRILMEIFIGHHKIHN